MNIKTTHMRRLFWGVLLLGAALMSGCATGPSANPRDPLEPFNRGVFKFNDAVDRALLKPAATVYVELAPSPVRQGIGNFFGNLEDAWSFVNNSLQLKGQAASDSLARVLVNTTLGIAGLFDVASDLNIDKHSKDFGHTLGYWGVAPGPYLVLPVLGPSTVRDGVARVVDSKGDIAGNITDVPARNALAVVRVVDIRAGLLKATAMLDEIALDRYTFTRDSYLQSRRSAIYDGNPPDDSDSEKPLDYQEEAKP